ncbi:alpha/beta hydrolase [Scytonema hofmannii PCC 7110]|uniref:Alpha/beta hydrolase n=1 Tax=Scytonema hofmannii PCC 7110 TaxID=128403 RepID=A0A139WUU9_9CYAN|nr:alpha/beta hydrolase [Scytonema hofmannii]KYC36204.1 alpha/beta hydrolase [Scytonema hofmannii PCC 7110]
MDSLFRNSRRKLSQGLLFWREVGAGTPVIFLHGSWNDSSQWVSLMELLSQNFHCFALDLFGFGESEHPNIHHSIDLHVECLAEFLQALKLERVYLVGHSLGSWIAASYSLKYPEQVYGLVLISPEGIAIEGQQKRLRKMRRIFKFPPTLFQILRVLRPIAKIFGWDEQIERDWKLRQAMLGYPTACELLFQRQEPEIKAELLQDRLSSILAPVLILEGGKDSKEFLDMSRAYAQYLSQAELKAIAHGAHNLPESCAAVVAGDIRDFLTVTSNQ